MKCARKGSIGHLKKWATTASHAFLVLVRAFTPKPQRIAQSLCGRQAERAVQVVLIESVSSLGTLSGNNLIHLSNRYHFAGFAEYALQRGHWPGSSDDLIPPWTHFDKFDTISHIHAQCEPHVRRYGDLSF